MKNFAWGESETRPPCIEVNKRRPISVGASITPTLEYAMPPFELLIPLTGMVVPMVIVGLVSYFRYQSHQLRHETLRRLAEQGIALTPELLESLNRSSRPKREECPESRLDRELRQGMVLLWTGLGVMGGLYLVSPRMPWGMGLVPLCIGLGYLMTWKLSSRNRQ
ncbi:DUF6249 domain-containing protein [Chitinimonas lacunae]|uniref:DUF6249 domain-containing protein n=1 Tax=Chitinimonas lacunae TaxID=1963018 RepID=A0ABV8MSC5_9NEIS